MNEEISEKQRIDYYKWSNYGFEKQAEIVNWFVGGTILYLLFNPLHTVFWYIGMVSAMLTIFLDFLDYTCMAHLYEKCANEFKEIYTPNWMTYFRKFRYGTIFITIVSLIILFFTN
jgi:hypothetical protein